MTRLEISIITGPRHNLRRIQKMQAKIQNKQYTSFVNIQNIIRFASLCNTMPGVFLKQKRKGQRYQKLLTFSLITHCNGKAQPFVLFRNQKVQSTQTYLTSSSDLT